ncbi:MAG: pentapeptide repeat-containing protein [Phormidesmis sp.]
MKTLANLLARTDSQVSISKVSSKAVYVSVVALGLAGATAMMLPQAASAANPADIAQLTEMGICKACDLSEADLTGAHLIGADLREANLTGAILTNANLEGADLTGATLIDTDFSGAFLTNALLDNTIITNVDFSGATLIYTSLDNADVDNVNLVGANVINTPISIGGSYDQ